MYTAKIQFQNDYDDIIFTWFEFWTILDKYPSLLDLNCKGRGS